VHPAFRCGPAEHKSSIETILLPANSRVLSEFTRALLLLKSSTARGPRVINLRVMVLDEIAERLIASQEAAAQALDFNCAETILYAQRFPVCFYYLLHRLRRVARPEPWVRKDKLCPVHRSLLYFAMRGGRKRWMTRHVLPLIHEKVMDKGGTDLAWGEDSSH